MTPHTSVSCHTSITHSSGWRAPQLAGERRDPMINPTLLVHEAFFKLQDSNVEWQDRQHYLAVFVRAMRQVLIDLSRRRHARRQEMHCTITVNLPDKAQQAIDVVDMGPCADRTQTCQRTVRTGGRASLFWRPHRTRNR